MTDLSADLFIGSVLGYQQTAAMKAAIELDLFTEIGKGVDTVADIARATGSALRGIRILCDYLAIHGHLEKTDTTYRLTPSSAMFLDRRSPSWIGGVIEFLAAPEMTESFLKAPASYVRNGGSAGLAHNAPDHPIWVKFAQTMGAIRALVATRVASDLATNLPHKILDVAAGNGAFGIALAQAVPGADITAVDWESVLLIAKKNADAAGVSGRYHTLAGSAFEVDWGNGFDLVMLANVLHQFDYASCVALLQKVHRSLAVGGRAAVITGIIPTEDEVQLAQFSFQMLGSTPGGQSYTAGDLRDMAQAAGFEKSDIKSLAFTSESLVILE